MAAAYILAGELHRDNRRYDDAFARYISGCLAVRVEEAARRGGLPVRSLRSRECRSSSATDVRVVVDRVDCRPVAGREFGDRIALPDD
jgi:hypothetical protein